MSERQSGAEQEFDQLQAASARDDRWFGYFVCLLVVVALGGIGAMGGLFAIFCLRIIHG